MRDARAQEKLETLDGSRRGARRKAAVRIEDVAGLLELPSRLRSAKAAGDPPTQAEHDALVADLAEIHRVLSVVVTALQARLL